MERSQAAPTSDAVRESDGDSTVAASHYHNHHDRTMTRIRGIISSIVWNSADISWEFCGSVLKKEDETEKKVVQDMARCQELCGCEFIDRPNNQQAKWFSRITLYVQKFTPNSADLNMTKTVKSSVMGNTVSNFSN